ncbi:MAG: PIN domain-containing protein [Myxococcota bacterium]
MNAGITLDTGALIALARRKREAVNLLRNAQLRGRPITVPAVVIAEWWRGQRGVSSKLLKGLHVDPVEATLAFVAGEALGHTGQRAGRPGVVDALVMASAAQRGDVVYTSDVRDLERLRGAFPEVRVFRV